MALAAVLVLGCSVAAAVTWAAEPGTALLTQADQDFPATQLQQVQQTVQRRLERSGDDPVTAAPVTARLLTQHPELRQQLELARRHLSATTVLVQQVKYRKALARAAAAEAAARRGLAQLVEPRLLADIYLQRGIALLPLDAAQARAALTQSMRYAPTPDTAMDEFAPHIRQALRQAHGDARALPPPAPSAKALRRVLDLLGRSCLVWVSARSAEDGQEVRLLRTCRGGAAVRQSVARWSPGAPAPRVRERVTHATGELVPRPPAQKQGGFVRRGLPWVLAGSGAAALVAGAALLYVGRDRVQQAEDLAGQTPPQEYGAEAEGLERSGGRLQTGGVIALAVGGAAVAGALTLWLWPNSERPQSVVSVGPGSLWLTLRLP